MSRASILCWISLCHPLSSRPDELLFMLRRRHAARTLSKEKENKQKKQTKQKEKNKAHKITQQRVKKAATTTIKKCRESNWYAAAEDADADADDDAGDEHKTKARRRQDEEVSRGTT